MKFNRVTSQGPLGIEYTFKLSDSVSIKVVRPERFVEFTKWGAISHTHGQEFMIGEYTDSGGCLLFLVSNIDYLSPADIGRDSVWRKRLELAARLPEMLRDKLGDLSDIELYQVLPQQLVMAASLLAFGPSATEDDVLRAFFTNSQEDIYQTVEAVLKGELDYDLDAYAELGPSSPTYSHIRHFAWLYAQEILTVDEVIKQTSRVVTVVDLGTGCASFLLTLKRHLEGTGTLSRVKLIGIDRSDNNARFGKELADGQIEFLIGEGYDLSHPSFADRLRSLRPTVVVCNHVIEHLPIEGDEKNRYLHDWLLATDFALTVSVPLRDGIGKSISGHLVEYSVESFEKIARDMELRTAHAVETQKIDETKCGGMVTWVKKPDVRKYGGFNTERVLTLIPGKTRIPPLDPILRDDFEKPFDPTRFNLVRRAQVIGRLRDEAAFARQEQEPRQVRQLLIKLPGTPVKLPIEFEQFVEAVQMILDHNKATNPHFDRSYFYFNVFRGESKPDSYRGLSRDIHGDQLQSLHWGYAFPPDWSYIVSSCLPTTLYEQPFDISQAVRRTLRGEQVNLYDVFHAQADDSKIYRTDNFAINLLSPYIAHCATDAERPTMRVFLKVAVSTKRFFDNREIRRPPAFDIGDWYREPTIGRIGGWFSHDHWNERFLQEDVCPGWQPGGAFQNGG